MLVQYYEVKNCEFDERRTYSPENPPILYAPFGAETWLLQQYGFYQDEYGMWVHVLNPAEYQYLVSLPQGVTARFGGTEVGESDDEKQKADRLGWIALALWLIPIVAGRFNIDRFFSPLFPLCQVASLVLTIFVRVKYPKNRFGKVMMWLLIISVIVSVIFLIIMAILCNSMAESCRRFPD